MMTRVTVALPVGDGPAPIAILMADEEGHASDRILMVDAGYARAFASDLLRAADESDRRERLAGQRFGVVEGSGSREGGSA